MPNRITNHSTFSSHPMHSSIALETKFSELFTFHSIDLVALNFINTSMVFDYIIKAAVRYGYGPYQRQ